MFLLELASLLDDITFCWQALMNICNILISNLLDIFLTVYGTNLRLD